MQAHSLNPPTHAANTVRYSIMPDYPSAYGWTSHDERLGGNHADETGWYADHPISDQLHQAFCRWQLQFTEALPCDKAEGLLDMDWERFHHQGLALTRRLKAELGHAARVFYVKPYEDPNIYLCDRREILADGVVRVYPDVVEPCLAGFPWLPRRIVTGGQTGADRAALVWACLSRIPHGGWCPKGHRAEDGPLPRLFQLRETASPGYRKRTQLNVRDSDATLILNWGQLEGGTLLTARFAEALKKPCQVCQLDHGNLDETARQIVAWLSRGDYRTLNIAGPREENRPGIYDAVFALLDHCLLDSSQA